MRLSNAIIDRITHRARASAPLRPFGINPRLVGTFLGAATIACAGGGNAIAANCSAYPYTLTNGTTADATQVMGNFNNILNCSNNSLAASSVPTITGSGSVPAFRVDATGTTVFNGGATGLSGTSTIKGLQLRFDTSANIAYIQATQYGVGNYPISFGPGINALYITSSGNVGINSASPSYNFYVNGSAGGTQAWQSPSDMRLKKDVVTISSALGLVQKLRGVRFNWKPSGEREVGADLKLPTGERQLGFIAQEVAAVVPEAVVAPAKGSNTPYALKEADLIPLLVEAIKEQQVQIEQLRASLKAITVPSQH